LNDSSRCFNNNGGFDDWSDSGGFNRCGFNNGSRSSITFIGGLLSRRLLGGLFLFNWSNLAYEAGGFSFALEHRHECFNQS
jgi:hypothetical protein